MFLNPCDCTTATTNKNNKNPHTQHNNKEKTNIHKHLMVFSDGGARGNPGPAATAYIIQTETNQTIATNSQHIGICTNNQAEYKALIAALEAAAKLKAETLTCHLDSELVAKQLTGEYRVKNQELRQLWQETQEELKQFKEIKFINVPRTHKTIQQVDKLVNQTLDEKNKTT